MCVSRVRRRHASMSGCHVAVSPRYNTFERVHLFFYALWLGTCFLKSWLVSRESLKLVSDWAELSIRSELTSITSSRTISEKRAPVLRDSARMSIEPLSEHLVHEDRLLEERGLDSPPTDPELGSTRVLTTTTTIRPSKRWSSKAASMGRQLSHLHQKTPFLKRLPSYVIVPVTILILVNCTIWAIVGIILRYHPYNFYSPQG
jgi:hypothetical protein